MAGEVLVFCREGELPRKTGAEAAKVAKGDAFLPSLLNSRELRVATSGGIPGSGNRAGGNTGGAVGCGANLNGKHETYHLGPCQLDRRPFWACSLASNGGFPVGDAQK